MRNAILLLMAVFLLLLFVPRQLKADEETNKVTRVVNNTDESPDVIVLILRLNEIKTMDFKALNSSEKKVLRKELRSIKKQLEAIEEKDNKTSAMKNSEMNSGGGVYLSAGAIIIIILLLILLF